jgi:4-oxalocrotonate tautomerase
LGLTYTDDLILVEITFIAGRNKDARLTLLRVINERVVSAMGISPDDLAIMAYETVGENVSFGRGEAQRAHIGASS